MRQSLIARTALSLSLALFAFGIKAQTFINSPVYSTGQTVDNDTLPVGPISFSSTNNNRVWALVNADQDQIVYAIEYDSLGNQLSTRQVTQSFTLSYMNTTEIFACPDNGCVFATNHVHTAPIMESRAYRLNASGGLMWAKDFDNATGPNPPYIYSIKPTYYNTSIIEFNDSLREFNSTGNIIRTKLRPDDFQTAPDSNLIIYSSTAISKEDFSGHIAWTVPRIGKPLFVDSNYFYTRALDTITKFNNANGNIVWQKIIPAFDICFKKDGGYIITGAGYYTYSNDICNYDSSGNLIWCRSISFPLYGFRRIAECTPNCFITGGATPCFHYLYLYLDHQTGAFICSFDSLGNSVIDSTDHFISGNANDNYILGFVDDGPFIAAAMGTTGIARSTPYQIPLFAVYNQNWNTQFGVGINHKYSDVDGNGIIDTNDLRNLQFTTIPGSATEHWRLAPQQASGLNFKISVEEDSLIPGDTISIYIILGDTSVIIDSIYSIAFSLRAQYLFYQGAERLIVPTNDFGDTLINLMYFKLPTNSDFTPLLISRTNHQNASFYSDTIAIFRMPIPSGMATKTYTIWADVNAITKEGFPVNLNVIEDSVYYSDPFLSSPTLQSNNISIYPNPTTDFIFIDAEGLSQYDINIFDITGSRLKHYENISKNCYLKLDDMSQGSYLIQINSGKLNFYKKIVLQ